MSEIALRSYVEHLDSLIERKQIDEVLAHCRHILGLYPKHVDTYRMLGKALLEKSRHTDAADIFQRVLSVAPDDFIAHVGMAIVREDEANLAAAIWHMERAFEASPSNGAIQQELCRLYGRRDGVTPTKARLTRGALARMYSQGGLFLQAEAELKSALSDDPERIDLSTVLARVYWQSGQPAEAAQVCSTILEKLPFSLEANRILAAIFRDQGREADATAYRQRLEALDPYEAFVAADRRGSSARRVDAGRVTLQRLDYTPGTDDGSSPDWLNSIGAKFEEPATRQADSTPDWLTDESDTPVSPAEVPAAAELPDWLRDLQPQATQPPAPSPAAGTPDWLNSLGVVDAPLPTKPANEDLPEWLRTATGPLTPEAVPEWMAPAFSEPGQPPPAERPQDDVDDELPGWLAGLTAAAAGTAAALTPAETLPAGDADAPDKLATWLASTPAGKPDEALPEWMQTVESSAPVSLAEAADAVGPPDPAADPTVPQAPATLEPPEAPAGATLAGSEAVPAWLAALAPVGSDRSVDETTLGSTPAGDVTGLGDGAAIGAEAEGPAASPHAEAGITAPEPPLTGWPEADDTATDWLAALSPVGAVDPVELAPAEVPDWLKAAAPDEAQDVVSDVPAWLKAASNMGAAELPEWMRAGPTPEPGAMDLPGEAEAFPPTPDEASLPIDQVGTEKTDDLAWGDSSPGAFAGEQAATEKAAEPLLAGASDGEAEPAALDSPPDWPSPPASEALPSISAATVPDWLQAVAATAPEPDATIAAGVDDAGKPMPELPDFLQPASAAAIARSEQPIDFGAGSADLDDTGYSDEPEEPDLVLPAEIPAWLQALAPISPDPNLDPANETRPPVADEMPQLFAEELELPVGGQEAAPDWLAELNAAEPGGGLPPWMAEIDEQPTKRPVTGSLVVPASEAELAEQATLDLPPWAEADAPGPSDTIADWLKAKDTPDWQRTAPVEDVERQAVAGADQSDQPNVDLAATQAGEAPGDLPPWAQAQSPGASDTIVSWLAAKEVAGDTLELQPPVAAAPPTPEATSEPAAAATPTAQPETEASAFDDDEALRWLEGLAAQQGARPEELISAPEDRPAETPAWIAAQQADPSTLQEATFAAPAAEGTVAAEAAVPREAEDGGGPAAPATDAPALSDWLGQMERAMPPDQLADTAPRSQPQWPAETRAPEPQTSPESASPVEDLAGPPTPQVGEIAGDEALAWLEGLAARQGANPDELLTAPEDRPADTPPWITAMETTLRASIVEPADGDLESATDEAEEPDLAEMDASLGVDLASLAMLAAKVPGEPTGVEPPAPISPPEMEAATALDADDEALRWLESLAARQGAEAEALLTPPEGRLTDTPAWVAAEAAAGSELAAEPPPLAEPEPAAAFASPEWLPGEAIEPADASSAELPPAADPAQSGDPIRLSRLAERLAVTRREREAEIEARFAEQRAEQEAARRLVQERMEAKRVDVDIPSVGAGPRPSQPAAAPPAPAEAPDLAATVTHYASWIDTGKHVDQAIRELEGLANQAAPAAPLLRVLGDAYARQERLTEALEAYRMALARL